jgi:type III secretory pathway lipoprotein EscJ
LGAALLALCACSDVTLAHGLSEREAKDISAQLNRRGVAATQTAEPGSDRFSIQVAQSAVPQAWDALGKRLSASQSQPAAATALLSTREAELRAEEQRLEQRLSQAIEALPNVHSAAVLLTLPRTENKLSDMQRAPAASAARAVVSLVCAASGACPNSQRLHPLLSAVVPSLTANNLRVLQQDEATDEQACSELAHIGPLTVTRASLPTLKLWLAVSLIVHMLGSLALLSAVQRKRQQAKSTR